MNASTAAANGVSYSASAKCIPYRPGDPVKRIARIFLVNGLAVANSVAVEVRQMIAAAWLLLSSLFYSLQLTTGSFPKPLTAQEEQHYLKLFAQGDLEARNVLVERNLRLVAHIMKKY